MADSKNNKKDAGDRVFRCVSIAFVVLELAALVVAIVMLSDGKSENFRNWMLVITTIGAAYFWWGRNRALKQQAETDRLRLTDERLSDAAKAKADQIRLADERFSDAVKLLSQNDKNGKPAIAARLGGIFVLEKLAESPGLKYFAQVVKTLFAYIKENIQLTAKSMLPESKMLEQTRFVGEDVKAAFGVLEGLLGVHKQEKMKQFGLSDGDYNFCNNDFSWLFLSSVKGIDFCNYISTGIDMRGAMLSFLDLRSANLSYTKLQKSALQGANLQGARLEHAELQGADLSEAKLLYADFSGAELDEYTKLSSGLSEQIWHSGQAEFKKRKIESRAWDAEWDLSPFLDSADSLVGVLCGYAASRFFLPGRGNQKMRAKKLRQAARKLQKDGKIPEGFPQIWLSWLSELKEDGSHPDDSYFA